MTSHREDVIAGEEVAVRRMIRAYRVAERSINAKLAKLEQMIAGAMADGVDPKESWVFKSKRYEALLDEIYTEIDKFASLSEDITGAQQKKNALRGVKNALELMKAEVKAS